MSVRSEILEQFKQVSLEQDKGLGTLSDDLPLMDSGLDSLCFTIIVNRLATSFGVDPFAENEDLMFPETLGDFVVLYEKSVQSRS